MNQQRHLFSCVFAVADGGVVAMIGGDDQHIVRIHRLNDICQITINQLQQLKITPRVLRVAGQVSLLNIGADKMAVDSPIRTVKTPSIIGFLTNPYIPLVTSFLVGLHGARVPSPFRVSVVTVLAISVNPVSIISIPIKKAAGFLIVISGSMDNGTIINTVTGRINENPFLNNFDICCYL